MNFADIVRAHQARDPDSPAIITARTSLTYGQLDRAASAVAARLSAQDLVAGNVVGLLFRDPLLHLVAVLAVARLGAVSAGIDWRSPPADRDAICHTLGLHALLADLPPAGGAAVRTLRVDQGWLEPAGAPIPLADVGLDEPAVLMLTGGTTGLPKAMVVTHSAMAWRAASWAATFNAGRGARTLSILSLATSAGLNSVAGQLYAGAAIRLRSPFMGAEEVIELVLRDRIEHATLVPTMLSLMLQRATSAPFLPDIKALVSTAARLQPEEREQVLARLTPNLYDSYGAAGVGLITLLRPQDIAQGQAGVGRPVLFTRVDIVDDQDRPLPRGEVGRVRVRSPRAARGYAGATGAQERNELFANGCVYPGDLGRIDGDGCLHLEGRASSVIIRGGENIHPEEIERVLLAHPAIIEAAVLGRQDRVYGEVPYAIVVARGEVAVADLVAHCRARLTAVKVPAGIAIVAALPKTSGGKVQRGELPALLAAAGVG